MRVSAKSDYAVRALIEIAAQSDDGPLNSEELGKRQDIPQGFLQAILADLRRAGILISQRGQYGGWRLVKDAATVSIADVVRAVDGPLVSVHGLRPESVDYSGSAKELQLVWIATRVSLREVLEHVTIQDLADRQLPDEVIERTRQDEAWLPH